MLIGDDIIVTATGVLCGETFGDMIDILTGKPVGLQRCAAMYRVKVLRDTLRDLDACFEIDADCLTVHTVEDTEAYDFLSKFNLEKGLNAAVLSDLLEGYANE